ncbi:hypothetical protein [Celeribacter arenosi]|uniref:Alpha/beta hydrolase n=1 Tax=Celeribacter arenosi TaxID=792649 RepID=A0ABP7JYZ3_9RHOB
MREPEVIHSDEQIRVSLMRSGKARTGRTLLSFTGVGHALNGIDVQKPEFFKAGQGYDQMFFISDLNRSWGNALDFDALADVLAPYIGDQSVDTLGNSMGGFLSLLAPAFFDVRRATAIVPQISVHPDIVPWETRWSDYRGAIRDWQFPSVAQHLVDRTDYAVVVGDDALDLRHVALLPQRKNLTVLSVPDGGHNVAARLKELGLLDDFVRHVMDGDDLEHWFNDDFLPALKINAAAASAAVRDPIQLSWPARVKSSLKSKVQKWKSLKN